jgi:hypothetical protein
MRWKRLGLVGVAVLGAAAGTGGTFGSGEQVGFDPTTVTVGEGDGAAVVTVARDACESGSFRLDWRAPRTSTNQSTATAGEDYESRFSNSVWARCDGEGREERVFTVPILDDDEAEGDETIQMSLSASQASTNSTTPLPAVDPDGEIVITDDDQLRLVASDVRVREADGVARVTVERRRGDAADRGEPMSLSWQTSDGTAKAGADYTETTEGELEIAGGESRASVAIPIRRDDVAERDEDFSVGFSWGEAGATATVTITEAARAAQQQQQPGAAAGQAASVIAISPRAVQQSAKGPCVSRRRFTVRLRGLKRGTVKLGGRALKTRRTKRGLTAVVDLRGRAQGRFRLRVTGVTRSGRKVTQTRTYRTCSPKRR